MSVRPGSEAPPPPEPTADGWEFIDDLTIEGLFGPTPGKRWRNDSLTVLASVDWRPMPRGWYYHLAVSTGNCSSPPSDDEVARAAHAFGLAGPEIIPGQTSPNIVHLYARAP